MSVPVAVGIPFDFVGLIGRAQDACLNVEAGGWFAMSGLWVLLAIAACWLFCVGSLLAWRYSLALRGAAGVGLVVATCLGATWLTVPAGSASDYSAANVSGACGPGGVPTWWPSMLPHH